MAETPTTIGRYQVQSQLGRGAMGAVYLAQDPLLKRAVAIKVVHPGGEDPETTLARFQREAEISARLNHPNIVMVFDVGEDAVAGPFIAMEYIEGTSLSDLIRSGLGVEAGVRLMIQGMGALMAAEAEGIVHRDIKPDNILVSRDGRFKLMDFGIARREESHLTQAGMIFGTPFYTAPELLLGAEASPATDRYAFVVTVFEVVTGRLPFQGTTVGSTLYKIVHEAPEIPADLSPAVAQVFRRALAKEPEARYPDLPSFLGALVDSLPLSPEIRTRFVSLLSGDAPFVQTHPFAVPSEVIRSSSDPFDLSEELAFLEPMLPSETRPGAAPDSPPAPAIRAEPPPAQRKVRWPLALAALLLVFVAGGSLLHLYRRPSYLSVGSTPPGADVSLDGVYVGQTPLRIRVDKPLGRRLHIGKVGYRPEERLLRGGEQDLEIPLEAIPFTIAVVTDPPGARVFLNRVEVGTTPLESLRVPVTGRQELRIQARGYQEWSALLEKDAPFPALIRLTPEN